MDRTSWQDRIAEAAASKKERAKQFLTRMKERQEPARDSGNIIATDAACPAPVHSASVKTDREFAVLPETPNQDLVPYVDLIDMARTSERRLHAALFWPHVPPRAILPWMLREVSRGRDAPPLRTVFVNMGRPALRAVTGLEARTALLRARGLIRSGVKAGVAPSTIGPDAHFYMFLGDTAYSGIAAVPLVSIVPHSVALNDGTFWRDFDEKTLKGFKRLYPPGRLSAIRKHLEFLSSAERSPSFAFLLPSHFPESDRRDALRRLPGRIDLAIVDMTTHAVRGRDASALVRDLMRELEQCLRSPPARVLVLTDCPLRLERIAPSYRYNQYLSYDALGINCGVRRRGLVDGNILETTSLPTYFQPLIRQFDLSSPPDFETLGAADGGLDVLRSLLKAFNDWLDETEAARPYGRSLDPVADATDYARERQQFEEVDLRGWRAERDAIARGLAILERAFKAKSEGKASDDPEVIPLTAWRFMNQTFREFWRAKNAEVQSWRLFQIAFILSQLPAVVSRLDCWKDDPTRMAEEDREATLLYFSTGGGKSESFFGLLVFCLAFDRLRGKQRGITALVRYPLRLLTSQQAQRLSQVLAAAYKVSWLWADRGLKLEGRGFEIGFWVGGGNTPNNRNVRGVSEIPVLSDDWDEGAARRGDYTIYLEKWGRLATCPFCAATVSGPNGKRASTIGLRRFREGPPPEERLAHFCFNKECVWNKRHGANARPHPLPIHIMDSDIYAHAPAVLLGTVDKLALIGQSARTLVRVLGMFGFPAWHHKESGRFFSPWTREQFGKGPASYGCEPVFPFYADGEKLLFDPYPLLEIQDEAHLLDESLGTFSGLFETTFHHALRSLAPLLRDQVVMQGGRARPPRIVAASATVSEPSRQIDQIYQRQVVLFPQPGPDLYESFYARLQRPSSGDPTRDTSDNAEHRTPTRRRYVSLMTNGRTHTAATVAVLSAFHLTITQVFKAMVDGDDASRWAVRRELADVLPSDIFCQGHRSVLLDPDVPHAQIAYAIDLDRIALLYVTNKKGGDNVKAALQDVIRRDHRLAGIEDVPGVRTALITGAIDAGRIGSVVDEAARKPAVGAPFRIEALRDSLRGVIATSAISHGVDVDEFNMMFFAGQPPDIAEYIQASSRVGRTHVGTSILIPTPQQRRDRYIVEIHDIFHRFLERMIDAAPVERWAENAITRTLASFLQLKLCGVDYLRKMNAAKTPADKAAQAEPDNVGEIGERSRTDHINLLNELREFVVDGIGLEHGTSPTNKEFYRQRIHQMFDVATTAMEQSNWKTENLESFFRQPASPLARPMTSLRDVNEAGLIEGGLGSGSDRIRLADLGRVMSALMRGNNSWTAGEAGE
ncbi:DEAD/DEAH box helicase family protein [Bradyrhizobium japonicum]|uniref:DEAD/DEAH box helicase family protein n=1 Tax=Bradyrhizobium japonicum TaxID=375 RepID=UPI000456AFCB|nr:DEAD/DEAH box helicase family protein [Bradyrhizobium japonicum]AHY52455.1 hypothetical protein BJS_05983 [Bradyrhizobium japonicum SEMIA 5079]MCD9110292.1 helicase [Bradyrhizobium japonicum]MCD9257471.1 helicase [Bradyrhizobium japonicum SEMIA 5079]MCD9895135.1 helicase [Bradyrhizobium japonicum]MCD9910741.1 helicase [Bradyrhizobium japonicum]